MKSKNLIIPILTDALAGALCTIAVLFLLLTVETTSARIWSPRDLELCHSICAVYRKAPLPGLMEKETKLEDDDE